MHQMSLGGRTPPGPAEGQRSPDPQAALKLLALSVLDPRRLRRLASRLTPRSVASRFRRSETERSGSSFLPFEHWKVKNRSGFKPFVDQSS